MEELRGAVSLARRVAREANSKMGMHLLPLFVAAFLQKRIEKGTFDDHIPKKDIRS